ncbi:GNAT family N-acetyltransferase [Jeotgalicoccus sp. WY2]|uniref:GNAT family N-acetyltransferase n=1 Tax=Jeotgalicoccus sp. WY2 TaxID=2708346 RepID=UPI001BD4B59B|nr:GNAT family N-acetyltransferase [Jeotgalicoccus sp. WY2]
METRLLTENEQPPMALLLTADPSETVVKDYLDRGHCYIAEIDNQAVGVYVLVETSDDTAELINIAVYEQHQGKGIGKALVKDAIQKSKDLGFKTLEVGTGNSSIDQLALYQKCGFRITGVDKDFFIRHYEEEIFENGIQCIDMVRLSQEL